MNWDDNNWADWEYSNKEASPMSPEFAGMGQRIIEDILGVVPDIKIPRKHWWLLVWLNIICETTYKTGFKMEWDWESSYSEDSMSEYIDGGVYN